MKTYRYTLSALLLFCMISCDKDFEKTNTNPLGAISLEPNLQLANSQYTSAINTYNYEAEIVQQIITPFGGILAGGNHNVVSEANVSGKWNAIFDGPIKNLVDILHRTESDGERSNLYNISRILKAFNFMILVDAYGDVPYFEAGQGFLTGNFQPKYDPQEIIYEDLLREIEEATNQLDPGKDIINEDLFYKGEVSQWRRLGNSILLRLGMRYSEIDPAKARKIIQTAVDPARGGVMLSNADNAVIVFNTTYPNPTSNYFIGSERGNFYVGAPFVNQLKAVNDPRIPVIMAKYEHPTRPLEFVGSETTKPSEQIGMPYGYDNGTVDDAPGFPGIPESGGFAYSQFNRRTVLKAVAPMFLITYAQTQLLLAEAAVRSWVTGDPFIHYSAGIKAHMEQFKDYDSVEGLIPLDQQEAYLNRPEIRLSTTLSEAIRQINEQYWIASFLDGSEAWANFRRSGFPALAPNKYPGRDAALDLPSADGFIRRFPYPINEKSVNKANVGEAITRQGGDNFSIHIFWDK